MDRIQSQVDDLLARMTSAEKVGQLVQYFYFRLPAGAHTDPALNLDVEEQPRMVESALGAGTAGSLLFVTDPAEINRLQRLGIDGHRLGIPLMFGFDVIHGLRTILPVPIAMAASWDPALIEQGQSVAAREARAVGIHWAFAPMIDIARDPRWGRIVESGGEDPYLGASVAAAQVRGFQGSDVGASDRIIAGPKHLAGYGAAHGGRDYDEVDLSDSELWNVYLPPFRAAVEAGAHNIMTAYMDLNGIPASGNDWLLTEVLRDALGFRGFTVSDANAVRNLETHGFAADPTDAGARALNAGVDMEMAISAPAYDHLTQALESGGVTEETLDASVRRVLEAKIRLGLFDTPYVDEDRARDVLADPGHRDVARIAAQRSFVLLRNEGNLLPLDAQRVHSIAVIGPLADSRRDTIGPWVFDFDLDETVTVLEGLRARVGDRARIDYAQGVPVVQRVFPSMFDMFGGNRPADPGGFDAEAEFTRAVDLARDADVAVIVAGEWQNMIGEAASRSSLDLPGRQADLLEAVVETGTPVVLLVMSGRPLDLRWAAENVPAIIEIWYPGTQGGAAVADVLLGDRSPGGKLPFSWPRTAGQIPMVYSHTRSHEPDNQARRYWDEASTPLFPFGYGLSYGSFEYAGLEVSQPSVPAGGTVTVSVEVTNTADREADEVAQLYLNQRHGSASRPVRELKGFQRITLAGRESRRLEFRIGPAERRYWNAAARDWVLDNSTFDVWVGGDSQARLRTTFDVAANHRTLVQGQSAQVWIGGPGQLEPELLFETSDVLIEAPNWSGDGEALFVNGGGRLWRLDVAAADAGLAEVRFAQLPDLNNDHVLDPHGRQIYMSAMDGHIYRGALTGGAVERVTPEDSKWHFLHGVSPDGSQIAYVELDDLDHPGKLVVMELNGVPVAIDTGSGHLDGPEWSPDGRWIYFNTESLTATAGHAQLARMPVNGGSVHRVAMSDTVDWFPHLSPDGQSAAYIAFPAGTVGHPADVDVEVRVVAVDDWTTPLQRYPLFGGQGTINVNSWSPDSKRFAFIAYPIASGPGPTASSPNN